MINRNSGRLARGLVRLRGWNQPMVRAYSETTSKPSPETNQETTEEPMKQIKLEMQEKDKQIAQLQDAWRRSLADMENLRQRTRKEVENASVFAIQKFAKDLLDTADVLQLALDSVPKDQVDQSKPLKDLFTGVSLTKSELLKCFKRFGIEPYDPKGEQFDPNFHQAIYQVPGDEPGKVIQTTKTGYKIHDRVLRPAQVGVVKQE